LFIDPSRRSFFMVIFLLWFLLWDFLFLFGLIWCRGIFISLLDFGEVSSGFVLGLAAWVVNIIDSRRGWGALCLSHSCRVRAIEEPIQQSVDFTIEDLVCKEREPIEIYKTNLILTCGHDCERRYRAAWLWSDRQDPSFSHDQNYDQVRIKVKYYY
jgi:hypothetical protein